MTPFSTQYRRLIAELATPNPDSSRDFAVNARTGVTVVALPGRTLSAALGGAMPTVAFRRTRPRVAAAELAWFLQGTRDVTWLRRHAKIWDDFMEEDGTTVLASYGWRWRRHFGRDQLRLAVNALLRDPSDRRVYVSAWDPSEDGLGAVGQRNVPCPAAFTLSCLGGRLHSTLLIRSSDTFVGLPYDALGHALLMDAVACELGIAAGEMQVSIAHPHLYQVHWDLAAEGLRMSDGPPPAVRLPGWPLSEIEVNPDAYVEAVRQLSDGPGVSWPGWDPKPRLVK